MVGGICEDVTMPRSNRPRRSKKANNSSARRSGPQNRINKPGQPDRVDQLLGMDLNYSHQDDFDGGWHVRQIPAWRAVKDYTCPGCYRQIPQGQPHVVAWRSDWIFGDEAAGEQRRHWHSACWKNRQQDHR